MLDGVVSLLSQKQYRSSPFQHLLNKLSFIKIIPFSKNPTKTLIFRGSFNFQIDLSSGKASWFTICLYIDCRVKDPSFERLHLIESCWSSNCTNAVLVTSCCFFFFFDNMAAAFGGWLHVKRLALETRTDATT